MVVSGLVTRNHGALFCQWGYTARRSIAAAQPSDLRHAKVANGVRLQRMGERLVIWLQPSVAAPLSIPDENACVASWLLVFEGSSFEDEDNDTL